MISLKKKPTELRLELGALSHRLAGATAVLRPMSAADYTAFQSELATLPAVEVAERILERHLTAIEGLAIEGEPFDASNDEHRLALSFDLVEKIATLYANEYALPEIVRKN